MIRVNLLPVKRAKRLATAKRELLLFTIITLLVLIALIAFYVSANSGLKEKQNQARTLNQQLAEDKKSIGDTPAQEKRKIQLQQQLAVLNDLQKRRTGPVRVLDELQEMLSPPRNREAQLAQAQNNWNVDWDPRRIWITSLKENAGNFELTGAAENADDVAEFMRRLETAEHFSAIQLKVVETDSSGRGTNSSVPRTVKYSLSGKISYAPKADAELEKSGGNQ